MKTIFCKILVACFFLCGAVSCSPDPPAAISFYFFKTTFSLTPQENELLEKLPCRKVYLRIFDVDIARTGNIEIIAPLRLGESPNINREVVPLIFITNRTFSKLKSTSDLYNEMQRVLNELLAQLKKNDVAINELQMDCDWTASTQADYFALLEYFKKEYPHLEITSTIRLHQLKTDKHLKPPPVKEGVLMCYNTGNIRDTAETNSILNFKVAQTYLPYLNNYPLKLNVAFPLFQWGVQYRHGNVINLLRELPRKELEMDTLLIPLGENRFRVKKSHYLNEQYIYKNDVVRHEAVGHYELLHLAEQIKKYKPGPVEELVFYDLDQSILESYPASFLQEVAQKLN